MNRSRRIRGLTLLALSIAFASAPTPSTAQNVLQVRMVGQPLVYTKQGAIHGCGIRFIIVDTVPEPKPSSAVATFDLSVNLFLPGHAIVKGGIEDSTIAAAQLGDRSKARNIAPASIWMKATGAPATKPLSSVSPGDDPGTILYSAALDSVVPLLSAIAMQEQILIGAKRQLEGMERIFAGRVELNADERAQIKTCMDEIFRAAAKK